MKKSPKTARKRTSPAKRQPTKTKGWRQVLYRGRFLPALVIATFATVLSVQQQAVLNPRARSVLAYATNVSPTGLLTATNTQRTSNGKATLAANALLSAAAQTKAEDMVARDYWAHVTPDGKQPWWFITNAGYSYTSAGENLAYGFASSSDTVTGWMNSPSHKANLLSGSFTEVGFGIANSENFTGTGQQTIVVAMYGAPQAAPVAAAKPAPKPQAPVAQPATKPAATVDPMSLPPAPVEKEVISTPLEESEQPIVAAPATINRVQLFGNGGALWSASLVVLAVLSIGLLWLVHKGFHLKRYVLAGEHFVAKHIHLDMTVLAIVYLGFVLLSSSGFVK